MDQTKKKKKTSGIGIFLAVVFWIVVWQIFAMRTGNKILVASPWETLGTLFRLIRQREFWSAVGSSFGKIATGFALAVTLGTLLAVLASRNRLLRHLLLPILHLIKAVPVASFIILALLWVSSKKLSVLISFLMVLPVIFTNVLQGIESTDRDLLEMAQVFRLSKGKRVRYIYLPAVLPFFVSACSVGLGFCFKSGIAAEVIGLPVNSIGEKLYEAKLYLMTQELFAWTAVIVGISFLFEKVVMLVVRGVANGFGAQYGEQKQAEPQLDELSYLPDADSGLYTSEPNAAVAQKVSASRQIGGFGAVIEKKAPENTEVIQPKEKTTYGLVGVTKSFGDTKVLENFTLELPEGSAVALMGPSGCGKSTVGKLMLHLLDPDNGDCWSPRRLGAVFQEDRLCMEFDAVTNVMLAGVTREEAVKALSEVGLAGALDRPMSAYSGGMKRRVAIVRALLSDAELLVLDEPFTGMDEFLRKCMVNWVKAHVGQRTLLLITHNEEEANKLCTQIVPLVQ